MKLKWSALVASASGKLGSIHCQGIQGVQSICRKPKQKRVASRSNSPANAFYSHSKAFRAKLSSSWHSLSVSQVSGWNSLANASGVATSGFNLFVKLNSFLAQGNRPLISNSPSFLSVNAPIITDFKANYLANITIYSVYSAIPAGVFALWSATKPLPPGRKPANSDYKTFAIAPSNSSFPRVITSSYTNYFGTISPVGHVIYFRARFFNSSSGYPSSWQYFHAIIQ